MQPPVVFDSVWKKFRKGERHSSLRDLVPAMAKGIFRRKHPDELENAQEFWALRDVSFEVHAGQALGIIGPNGAGKSTTLKLLTKILKPSRGSCAVRGRVGALIEVAAGFHPDLTGRENIFLQGAIMGMRRGETATRLDEIIEFAGVADFIDTPVKRYSSGMNARLGFSIAAHLNPDVLIIDEVLSVGDAAFQARCLNRMHEFRAAGVTIVFVSHNLQAVSALCDTTLFVRQSIQAIGPTSDVLRQYVAATAETTTGAWKVKVTSPGFSEQGMSATVQPGQPLQLRAAFEPIESFQDLTFSFAIQRSTDSMVVYEGHFTGAELGVPEFRAGETVYIDFGFEPHLTRGHYHIACSVLHRPTQRTIGRLSPAALISVEEHRTFRGIADIRLEAVSRRPEPAVPSRRQ